MKVLVVGLGSIGRRHVRGLRDLGQEVAVCRRSREDAESSARELGLPVFATRADAAAWGPDAVVVTNPTSAHVETARWAVGAGAHVLVEKPLSHTLDGVDELLEEARAAGVHLAVAYNLRFHPGAAAVKAAVDAGRIGRLLHARAEVGTYLPDWHPDEDYREGYAARADLGGGALHTLVHELDLVLWIAGDADVVGGTRARVSGLELDVDDVAEVVLRHRSGCLGSVHADFLDRAYHRRSRWVGEQASLEWSWAEGVRLERPDGAETVWAEDGSGLETGYREQLRAFLAAAEAGTQDEPGLARARRAVEILGQVGRA